MARKRRAGKREPNGRLQRPHKHAVLDDQRAQVLAQPHRQQDESQQCGDAFGRYCLQHDMPMGVYHAGQKYLHMVIRWRTLVGVPVNIDARVDHSLTVPLTPTELATMKTALRYQINKLERRIVKTVGRDTLGLIQAMLFEECETLDSTALRVGLGVMARQLGYFRTKLHPFK